MTHDKTLHGFSLSKSGWMHLTGMLAVLFLVGLVYWQGLTGGYVFDDFPNIVDNTALHVTSQATPAQWLAAIFSSPSSELQRPLAMLTFALNHALTGLNPYWMKLTNLAIHLVNTGLVFGLSLRILKATNEQDTTQTTSVHRRRIALWISAMWALNPINLMAVLFVVQRMESLCHTFVFAGLWLYLWGRDRLIRDGVGWPFLFAGLIGGTALGVLAKESAVLLPLYALLLEWTLLHFATFGRARDYRFAWLYATVLLLPAMVGLSWLLPWVLATGSYAGRNFSLGQRLLTEARVVVDYLHWTLLPNLGQLSLYHDDYAISRGILSPPSTLAAIVGIVALLGVLPWLRKRRPLMALGLAWFFAAQLLTATVVPLELMYEHRNYFASLGVCLLLADLLLLVPAAPHVRRAGVGGAIALLVLYAGLTAARSREWESPLRFAVSEATKHPSSPRATYDLARDFVILSNFQLDSPYTQKAFDALERALRVPNATPLPDAALITLAARTGQPIQPSWWESLQYKMRTHPAGLQVTGALQTLVGCQLQRGCSLPSKEMLASFTAALANGPNAEVLSIYGNYALNIQKDPTHALQLWRQAAQLAPNIVQYQETLARMLIATDQLDEAAGNIAHLRRMGRLGQNALMADELERLVAQARNRQRR